MTKHNNEGLATRPTMVDGEYPPLPKPQLMARDTYTEEEVRGYDEDDMRAYVDADRATRPTLQSLGGDGGVSEAIEWLRNNYQDHANIADLCDAMRASLTSTEKSDGAVPAGWQLVPKEPTAKMMDAAWDHTPLNMDDMTDGDFGKAYKDMLAAAPKAAEKSGRSE